MLSAEGDAQLKIQLNQRGVIQQDLEKALGLQKQINALKNREKIEEERAEAIQKRRIKSLKDMITSERRLLTETKRRMAELKKRDRSSLAGQLDAGASQRLLTGRAVGGFSKTAETIELERQTKLLEDQKRLEQQQNQILARIESSQQQIQVLGE